MLDMNRRKLLAGVGCVLSTAITGCLSEAPTVGRGGNEGTPENDGNNSESGVRTPDVETGVDEPTQDVRLNVELRREFSESYPGKIAVIVGNGASEYREFEYPPSPISHGEHESLNAHIKADYSATEYDEPPDEGCWRSPDPLGGEPSLTTVELEPGESISEEYILVAPSDDEYCLPDGIYQFESSVTVHPKDDSQDDVSDTMSLNWKIHLK